MFKGRVLHDCASGQIGKYPKLGNSMSDLDSTLVPSINLVSVTGNGRREFSFKEFNPKSVHWAQDLPPYLVMGSMDERSFIHEDGNWSARWQGTDPESYLTIEYELARSQYTITQCWHGIAGGISMYRDHIPLPAIVGQALNHEFPSEWDKRAGIDFPEKYALIYLPRMKSVPSFFGIPDGFFVTIAIPVHVSALREAIVAVSSLCKDRDFTSPMYVQAHRTLQEINCIEGKADAATSSPTNLFITNFNETGLLPLAMPVREVAPDGSAVLTVRRFTYVVCIHIPFSVLDFCLSWLSDNSLLVRRNGQASGDGPGFSMQPFIMPAGVDALGGEVSFTDSDHTTRLVWSFKDAKFHADAQNTMARPFDILLRERSLQVVESASKEQERIIEFGGKTMPKDSDPLKQLLAMKPEDRLEAVAQDLQSKTQRYSSIDAHALAGALGISDCELPGSGEHWSFIRYAQIVSVEEHAQMSSPASEIVHLIKDQVHPDRFAELITLSGPLDETDDPNFDFLTNDEREMLEQAIAEKDLAGHSSNGMNCLAHISVQTGSLVYLEFEAVIEDDGSSFILLTPYDKQAGKFEDLTKCVTDSW